MPTLLSRGIKQIRQPLTGCILLHATQTKPFEAEQADPSFKEMPDRFLGYASSSVSA
jgi:hypothetical protein